MNNKVLNFSTWNRLNEQRMDPNQKYRDDLHMRKDRVSKDEFLLVPLLDGDYDDDGFPIEGSEFTIYLGKISVAKQIFKSLHGNTELFDNDPTNAGYLDDSGESIEGQELIDFLNHPSTSIESIETLGGDGSGDALTIKNGLDFGLSYNGEKIWTINADFVGANIKR